MRGARLADDGSIAFRQGIANLESLLASLIIPQATALLANYPNPFNPETWIPYQLAAPAEVALTIYDMNGGAVRRLEIGHQSAGMYQRRSRAAYWDGRNGRGGVRRQWYIFLYAEGGRVHGDTQDANKEVEPICLVHFQMFNPCCQVFQLVKFLFDRGVDRSG